MKSSSDKAATSSKRPLRRRDLLEALRNFTREQAQSSSSVAKRKSGGSGASTAAGQMKVAGPVNDGHLMAQSGRKAPVLAHGIDEEVAQSAGRTSSRSHSYGDASAATLLDKSDSKSGNGKSMTPSASSNALGNHHVRSRSLFFNHANFFQANSSKAASSSREGQKQTRPGTTQTVQEKRSELGLARYNNPADLLPISGNVKQPDPQSKTSFAVDYAQVAQSFAKDSTVQPSVSATPADRVQVRKRSYTLAGTSSSPIKSSVSASSEEGSLPVAVAKDEGLRPPSSQCRVVSIHTEDARSSDLHSVPLGWTTERVSIDGVDRETVEQLSSQLLVPSSMAPNYSSARRPSTAARRYATRFMNRSEDSLMLDNGLYRSSNNHSKGCATADTSDDHSSLSRSLVAQTSLSCPSPRKKSLTPLPPRRQTRRARVQSSSEVDDSALVHARSWDADAVKTQQRRPTHPQTAAPSSRPLDRRTSESSLASAGARTAGDAAMLRHPSGSTLSTARTRQRSTTSRDGVAKPLANGSMTILPAGLASDDSLLSALQAQQSVVGREGHLHNSNSVRSTRSSINLDDVPRASFSSASSTRSSTASTLEDEPYAYGRSSLDARSAVPLDGQGHSPTSFASANSDLWGSCHSSASSVAVTNVLPVRERVTRRPSTATCSELAVPPVPVVPAKYATANAPQTHRTSQRPILKRYGSDVSLAIASCVRQGARRVPVTTTHDDCSMLNKHRSPPVKVTAGDDDDDGSICLETPTFGYVASFATAANSTPRASDSAVFGEHHSPASPRNGAVRKALSPSFGVELTAQPPRFAFKNFRPTSMQSSLSSACSGYDTHPLTDEEKRRMIPFRMPANHISPKTVDLEWSSENVQPSGLPVPAAAAAMPALHPRMQHGLGLSHVRLALAEHTHSLQSYTMTGAGVTADTQTAGSSSTSLGNNGSLRSYGGRRMSVSSVLQQRRASLRLSASRSRN